MRLANRFSLIARNMEPPTLSGNAIFKWLPFSMACSHRKWRRILARHTACLKTLFFNRLLGLIGLFLASTRRRDKCNFCLPQLMAHATPITTASDTINNTLQMISDDLSSLSLAMDMHSYILYFRAWRLVPQRFRRRANLFFVVSLPARLSNTIDSVLILLRFGAWTG